MTSPSCWKFQLTKLPYAMHVYEERSLVCNLNNLRIYNVYMAAVTNGVTNWGCIEAIFEISSLLVKCTKFNGTNKFSFGFDSSWNKRWLIRGKVQYHQKQKSWLQYIQIPWSLSGVNKDAWIMANSPAKKRIKSARENAMNKRKKESISEGEGVVGGWKGE